MKLSGRDLHFFGPPGSRWYLLGHATMYTGAIMSLWSALRHLPVGIATAMLYLHPVVCGLLAFTILKEPLGRIFWGQATISCIGVALVANLYGEMMGTADSDSKVSGTGKILIFISCMCFASGNCIVRLMPRCQPIEVQVFTDSVIALVAMPVLLCATGNIPQDASVWTARRLGLLAVLPAFGMCTSVLTITGFKMAPASIAALFMYLVPSSFAVQVFFFNQIPALTAVCGAALISIAAIARLIYEAKQQRPDREVTFEITEDFEPDLSTVGEDLDNLDDEFGDFEFGKMSRQNTLESCFLTYNLAHKATAKPYKPLLRQTSAMPSLARPFTPQFSPPGKKWSREFSAPPRMVHSP